jgi:hypothetical protein
MIVVSTEGGDVQVPILAKVEEPKLSLPSTINVGVCLIGKYRIQRSYTLFYFTPRALLVRKESESFE